MNYINLLASNFTISGIWENWMQYYAIDIGNILYQIPRTILFSTSGIAIVILYKILRMERQNEPVTYRNYCKQVIKSDRDAGIFMKTFNAVLKYKRNIGNALGYVEINEAEVKKVAPQKPINVMRDICEYDDDEEEELDYGNAEYDLSGGSSEEPSSTTL